VTEKKKFVVLEMKIVINYKNKDVEKRLFFIRINYFQFIMGNVKKKTFRCFLFKITLKL
jgi:hypothetical protein